jgi:hypothetical protein
LSTSSGQVYFLLLIVWRFLAKLKLVPKGIITFTITTYTSISPPLPIVNLQASIHPKADPRPLFYPAFFLIAVTARNRIVLLNGIFSIGE